MNKDIDTVRNLVDGGECTFAAVKRGVLLRDSGIGVKPIIERMREDRKCFKGFCAADKVIGKAAALLLVLSGVKFAYGSLMSRSAQRVFKEHGIPFAFGVETEYIKNRDHTDMCPLEKAVRDTADPNEAYALIEDKIAEIMKT